MKILMTGASGFLGKRMYEILSKRYETIGTYSAHKARNCEQLDIIQADSVSRLFQETRPDLVVHTAAMVDVDYCEDHREEAYMANVIGTLNLSEACKLFSSKLVYISSDFVFDGTQGRYTEESETSPLNFYGQTKLEGERVVQRSLDNYLIVRPALLYGNGRKNFVASVLEKLLSGQRIELDNKVIKYPILIDDVSLATRMLIESGSTGIYNVAGQEAITKHECGIKIAEVYGLPVGLIQPTAYLGKARRPLNVRLDISKISNLGFFPLARNFKEGIQILKNQEACAFRLIYSERPEALFLGRNASQARIGFGEELAREHPIKTDWVIPVPESGKFGAIGYSKESRIPFVEGVIRDPEYINRRTLNEPQITREESLEKKLIAIPEIVGGKSIALVDEAILSGKTMASVIGKLRKAGVSEIHVRIHSPPMAYNCNNGVLERDARLVIRPEGKKEEIENELRIYFGVDSLRFLSMDGFLKNINDYKQPCVECFYNDSSQDSRS